MEEEESIIYDEQPSGSLIHHQGRYHKIEKSSISKVSLHVKTPVKPAFVLPSHEDSSDDESSFYFQIEDPISNTKTISCIKENIPHTNVIEIDTTPEETSQRNNSNIERILSQKSGEIISQRKSIEIIDENNYSPIQENNYSPIQENNSPLEKVILISKESANARPARWSQTKKRKIVKKVKAKNPLREQHLRPAAGSGGGVSERLQQSGQRVQPKDKDERTNDGMESVGDVPHYDIPHEAPEEIKTPYSSSTYGQKVAASQHKERKVEDVPGVLGKILMDAQRRKWRREAMFVRDEENKVKRTSMTLVLRIHKQLSLPRLFQVSVTEVQNSSENHKEVQQGMSCKLFLSPEQQKLANVQSGTFLFVYEPFHIVWGDIQEHKNGVLVPMGRMELAFLASEAKQPAVA